MNPAEVVALRAIHIGAGVVWVGGAVFLQFAVLPALGTLGSSAGPVLDALQQRRLFRWLPAVAFLGILSGARLMWVTSGGSLSAYQATRAGDVLFGSAILAIVAFGVIMLVSRPAAARAASLAASLGGTLANLDEDARQSVLREVAAHRRTSGMIGGVATTALLVATLGMAVARYL